MNEMSSFTMESFEIIEKSERSIVPHVRGLNDDSLIKKNDCTITKHQLYCVQNQRDCDCHGCVQQRRFMRMKRDGRGVC